MKFKNKYGESYTKNEPGKHSPFPDDDTYKGKKKYKVKKAVSGLQDVAVPEQGSYSNVASSTASFAAAGSQFGPYGAAVGALVGAGAGFLQKDKQDSANRLALATNRDRKLNRSYAGDEETANQGMQRFKNGGKVKTKVIEIEGKKTPEIHTDKNFNVKNLGTTPHSMGGDKVHAEEGDIVFNTQNSLAKYNKIANAIQEGDHATLHKEKNKLPEDKSTKNQDGNRGVKYKPKTVEQLTGEGNKATDSFFGSLLGGVSSYKNAPGKESTQADGTFRKVDGQGNVYYSNGRMKAANGKMQNIGATSNPTPSKAPTETFNDGYKLPGNKPNKVSPSTTMTNSKSTVSPVNKTSINTTQTKPITTNPLSSIKFKPGNTPDTDLTDLKGSRSLDQVAESAKGIQPLTSDATSSPSKAIFSPSESTPSTSKGQGLNNALQFAGVANNLFQGLKSERPIDEQYYNPDKIKYSDRSQALRKQSSQAANVGNANARNLAGGNVGSIRANMNANRVADLDRQGSIDEREQGRADAIQAQNTQIGNEAKSINLQRKDNYQQLNMQNRAAKQGYIDQAASDIGQYGMAKREESYLRSRDDKAEASQLAGYNSINGRYQHKSNLDGSTYFEPEASDAITRFGKGVGVGVGRKRKASSSSVFEKGTKGVNMKYKMKSVV